MTKAVIFELLRKTAKIKGSDVDQERLALMTDLLSNYELDRIRVALNRIICNSPFFPDISEILKELDGNKSKDENANAVVGEIIKAIGMFGYYQKNAAKEYLGQIWDIVISMGGWETVCNTPAENIQVFRAQAREMAKSLGVSIGDIKPSKIIGETDSGRDSSTPRIVS